MRSRQFLAMRASATVFFSLPPYSRTHPGSIGSAWVSQNGTGRFNGRSSRLQRFLPPPRLRPVAGGARSSDSLRVELDDELLLDGHGDVLARGLRLHRALEPTLVEVEPGRDAAALDRLERLVDAYDPLAVVLHRHHVSDLHLVAGNVDLAAVHPEMPVADELPGLGAGIGETEPEDDVVEPLLEELEEVLSSLALRRRAARVVAAELRLEEAVEALYFLFLAQLHAVLGELGAALSVLPGGIGPPLDGALVGVAAVALQVHLEIFAPADAARAFGISSHCRIP